MNFSGKEIMSLVTQEAYRKHYQICDVDTDFTQKPEIYTDNDLRSNVYSQMCESQNAVIYFSLDEIAIDEAINQVLAEQNKERDDENYFTLRSDFLTQDFYCFFVNNHYQGEING